MMNDEMKDDWWLIIDNWWMMIDGWTKFIVRCKMQDDEWYKMQDDWCKMKKLWMMDDLLCDKIFMVDDQDLLWKIITWWMMRWWDDKDEDERKKWWMLNCMMNDWWIMEDRSRLLYDGWLLQDSLHDEWIDLWKLDEMKNTIARRFMI